MRQLATSEQAEVAQADPYLMVRAGGEQHASCCMSDAADIDASRAGALSKGDVRFEFNPPVPAQVFVEPSQKKPSARAFLCEPRTSSRPALALKPPSLEG